MERYNERELKELSDIIQLVTCSIEMLIGVYLIRGHCAKSMHKIIEISHKIIVCKKTLVSNKKMLVSNKNYSLTTNPSQF